MTGIRYNRSGIRALFEAKKKRISAASFRPQVRRYASDVLSKCVTTTPKRTLGLIRPAQRKQWKLRVNYIPSNHHESDPMLIVNDAGEHWLKHNAKWLHANKWTLRPDAWATYQMLLAERDRRMQTSREEFVEGRAQARFLYKKSWTQVARSLGVAIIAAGQILASRTRRKPPKSPPKAYGQWRGGKDVLSASIVNPFLEIKTAYWIGNGKQILAAAIARCRPKFEREIAREVERRLSE